MTTIGDRRKNLVESFDGDERSRLEQHLPTWEEKLNDGHDAFSLDVEQQFPDEGKNAKIYKYLFSFDSYLKRVPSNTQTTQTQPRTPTASNTSSSFHYEEEVIDGAIPSIREDPLKPDWMEKSAVDLIEEGIGSIITGKSFLAPFIFLLQSMGYGKTKAVWDLAAKFKRRVVYLPCMDIPTYSGDGGFWKVPTSLRKTIDFLQNKRNEQTCEHKWTKFLSSVKDLANKYECPRDLYNAQVTEDGKLGDFYQQLTYDPLNSPPDTESPILRKRDERENKKQKTANGAPSVRFRLHYDSSLITDSSLVVCLDEASAIARPSFHAFRRAAKHLGIIVVFSDTTASISRMASHDDPSCSRNGGDLGHLTLPIYRIPNFDLEWNPHSSVDDLEHLFKAGRPRWSSLLRIADDGAPSDDDLTNMVEEVKKLLTRNDHMKDADTDQLEVVTPGSSTKGLDKVLPSMIAVFTCRFGLGYTSKIGSLLAQYNLATIAYVSDSREIIHTHFPSEPVLAEASARYTMDRHKMEDVLEHVNAAVMGGLLSAPRGDLGEMCAAALLGFTMDKIRRLNHVDSNRFFFSRGVVGLHEFLREFGCSDTEKVTNALEGWKVNFTHFVRPSGSLDSRDLQAMWLRRKAFYVEEGMKGLDLLIVICHELHGFATLRIQVKNRGNFTNSDRATAFTKLAPTTCPPFVSDEKLSVCLLLCTTVESQCTLWDYKLARQIDPETRRSPRNEGNETSERLCLRLASPFVTDSNQEDMFAKKLVDICRGGVDTPEYWNVDEAPTDWDKTIQREQMQTSSE